MNYYKKTNKKKNMIRKKSYKKKNIIRKKSNKKKRRVGTVNSRPKILDNRLVLAKKNHDYISLKISLEYMIAFMNYLKNKYKDSNNYIEDIIELNKKFGRNIIRRAESFYTLIFSDELQLDRKKKKYIYNEMIPKYIDEHLLPLLKSNTPVKINNKIYIPSDVYSKYENTIRLHNNNNSLYLYNVFTD